MNAITAALIVTAGLCVLSLAIYNTERQSFGSVAVSNEYRATTSIASSAGTHYLASTLPNCTLGSIVVASTSETLFRIWDATSTTDVASTTLLTMDNSPAAGTYTFDLTCKRGIVVDTPASFTGVYVVTYR